MTTEHVNETIDWRDITGAVAIANSLTFSALLRAYRKGEGWAQPEAASRLGISKQMISQYETGKAYPSIREACRIATVLEIPLETTLYYLLNDQINRAGVTGLKVRLEQAS